MKLRLGGRWPLGLLFALVAMLTLAGAGSAVLPEEITPKAYKSAPCPPSVGRQFCVVLSTYEKVSKDGGLRVDLQVLNFDKSTMANPVVKLSWLPYDEVRWISPKPSACTEQLNTSTTRADDTLVSCAFANMPASGTAGKSPYPSETISLFFDADVTEGLEWNADGFVKESGNDPLDNPNTDVRSVKVPQVFGLLSNNQAISFGAPGATVELATQLGNSRLEFTTPAGTPPFQARFAADATTLFCFGGLDCQPVQLTAAVLPGGTGLMTSTFTVTTTKPAKNARVIHRYDKAGVTTIAGSKFQATVSYANIDGVRLSGLSAGLPAEGDYWVVNASAADKTFQISDKPNGKPITFTVGGTADAARIRIIGDSDLERAASCSALGVNVPSMFAESVGTNQVRICLGDSENGAVGGGW